MALLWDREPAYSTLTSALRKVESHYAQEEVRKEWRRPWTVEKMLMGHRPDPPKEDGPDLERWLDEAVQGFLAFEARFWQLPDSTDERPRLFIRKRFHLRWIRSILKAVVTGGKLMILSPPRHGKTELLQHLCVWLICRFPNIRIIWVGPNSDIAQETVSAVKDVLESDRELIAAVLGPGRTFAPRSRSGSRWSEKRFTVETRTVRGMKAPTLTAMGRATKTLSKDADLIVADDIEDHDSTSQPAIREDTRSWFFTQLQSRKQVKTAWFCIGSRQHPDDLWGYLLDDDSWEQIVETAHDPTCPHDPYIIPLHQECMLFPEENPYIWLYENWISARTLGREHLFEMVYLNNPRPEGTLHWTRELIALAHNHQRDLGPVPYQMLSEDSTVHLVAGLDPSATRYQASFLWAIELFPPTPAGPGILNPARMKAWMVDLDNHLGGGVDAFIDGTGQDWLERYNLRHWVIEYNLFRQVFSKHDRLLRWQSDNAITIEWIETTGQNKWDPAYGVGAMRQMLVAEPIEIDLPYGSPEARLKVETYTSEMLRFTDDPVVLKRRMTNVLMASWFPMRTARRWLAELAARVTDAGEWSDFSYPELTGSDYGDVPY